MRLNKRRRGLWKKKGVGGRRVVAGQGSEVGTSMRGVAGGVVAGAWERGGVWERGEVVADMGGVGTSMGGGADTGRVSGHGEARRVRTSMGTRRSCCRTSMGVVGAGAVMGQGVDNVEVLLIR